MILATEPLAPILGEARAHADTAHADESSMDILTLRTDDAGAFGGPDPRPDPAGWVTALNYRLPADF
ncbi:hypothetical protein ACFYN0_34805 [Streptomyces sp. NPDC006704]|uniref:hypothetical protein n=1 Tax=Streptomyces sp. NPDC006704 TaxID=3364760 RepID=UPI0036B641B7